jgi:tRNA threonylcarbamoyladenosine biosynthesis protein TsaB
MQRDFHHGLLMLLLALDTTTAAGSAALWGDGLIEEQPGDAARTHAERLPGELASLLGRHGFAPKHVTAYAVAAGPGSFTGLRVGIATVQGLALVHGRRVHAIGTLDLLAHDAARAVDADPGMTIVAWMEAYRGEVFAARFRIVAAAPFAGAGDAPGPRRRGAASLECLDQPCVGPPEPIADGWARTAGSGPVLVVGDGVARTRALLEAAFGARVRLREPSPLAGTLAALAAAAPDDAVRPHAIVPLYVRRPDAELARDRAAVRPTA